MPPRLGSEGARPVAAVALACASLVAAAAVGSIFLSTARDAWAAIAAAGPAGPADGTLQPELRAVTPWAAGWAHRGLGSGSYGAVSDRADWV